MRLVRLSSFTDDPPKIRDGQEIEVYEVLAEFTNDLARANITIPAPGSTRRAWGDWIYDTFIAPGAPFENNINDESIKRPLRMIRDNPEAEWTDASFRPAYSYISQLLDKNRPSRQQNQNRQT